MAGRARPVHYSTRFLRPVSHPDDVESRLDSSVELIYVIVSLCCSFSVLL